MFTFPHCYWEPSERKHCQNPSTNPLLCLGLYPWEIIKARQEDRGTDAIFTWKIGINVNACKRNCHTPMQELSQANTEQPVGGVYLLA